jgi:hypothetical protein
VLLMAEQDAARGQDMGEAPPRLALQQGGQTKVKRVGDGFRNVTNYRLRVMLYGVRWQTHRTTRLRGRRPRLVA